MSDRIAVLLSTCDGERYLAEQLDSILAQTHTDLVIVVRDDGSRDGTPTLLQDYRQQHAGKFHLVADGLGNLGARASYASLIEYVLEHKAGLGLEAAYLCLADQDDVWSEDRVATCWAAMQEAELGGTKSVLVHSDLEVVDETLSPIARSLAIYQGLRPQQANFGRVLVANAVTGCTVMINESLARLVLPIPSAAMMHDWWLGLVAAAVGETVYVDRALVKYRQHGTNVLGAQATGDRESRARPILARALDGSSRQILEAVAAQSQAFLAAYNDRLDAHQRRVCRIASLLRGGPLLWRKLLYRCLRRM